MKSNASHPSPKADPVSAYYRARERLREAGDSEVELTKRVRHSLESALENGRRPAASVRLSLWEQRQKATALLRQSKSRTDHILEQQKGDEGVGLRVYLERAFSDPSDYRFPAKSLNQEEKKLAIHDIILNPNHIPDRLFLDLTGISESDWKAFSPVDRLESKRRYLPKLKELFANAQLLPTGAKGATGRIVLLPYVRDLPVVAGSYLVFQELPSLDRNRLTARNSRTNPVSVKVLPDIWSLSRSQEHAQESLENKVKLLQSCQEELNSIRMSYAAATEEERREMIVRFVEKFNQKHAFAFRKIIAVRKPKLRYGHLGVDEMVLLGMSNDLGKYLREILSKQGQIFRQSQLLRGMADGHAKAFFDFFDAFYAEFSNFDGTDLEKRILADVPDLSFTTGEAQQVGRIWHLTKAYANVLVNPVVIGEPFFDIENRVIQSVKAVRSAPAKTSTRELLKLVVQMKLGACRILLRQMDDAFETGRFVQMRTQLAYRVERLVKLFESLQFLKSVKLGKKLDAEFASKLETLRAIRERIRKDDIAELREFLSAHLG